MHEILIPGWHPVSTNKLLNSHWATAMKLKRVDAQMIAAYARHVPKANGKRKVLLILEYNTRGRRCDPDNHFKSVLDGLVKCGMLTDDNEHGCELMPVVITTGKHKNTIIRLYDIS